MPSTMLRMAFEATSTAGAGQHREHDPAPSAGDVGHGVVDDTCTVGAGGDLDAHVEGATHDVAGHGCSWAVARLIPRGRPTWCGRLRCVGDTSLEWDRRPDSCPSLVRTPQLWCFGSMRMFLAHVANFSGWKLAQDLVWEKQQGILLRPDRFVRVHEGPDPLVPR